MRVLLVRASLEWCLPGIQRSERNTPASLYRIYRRLGENRYRCGSVRPLHPLTGCGRSRRYVGIVTLARSLLLSLYLSRTRAASIAPPGTPRPKRKFKFGTDAAARCLHFGSEHAAKYRRRRPVGRAGRRTHRGSQPAREPSRRGALTMKIRSTPR